VRLISCDNKIGLNNLVKELELEYKCNIIINPLVTQFFNGNFTLAPKDINDKHTLLILEYWTDVNKYVLSFPMGKRHFGESFIEAAHRECKEETLIDFDFNTFYKSDVTCTFIRKCMGYICFNLDNFGELNINYNKKIINITKKISL